MENELKYLELMKQLITKTIDIQYERAQEYNFKDMNEENKNEHDNNPDRIIELNHNINEMLPPEGKKMLFDLDCLTGANLSMESCYMFKRGAIEGLTNLDYLKSTSEYVYLPSIKL